MKRKEATGEIADWKFFLVAVATASEFVSYETRPSGYSSQCTLAKLRRRGVLFRSAKWTT